ncbi:hypothetical protein B0T24DRAFT_596583 [Lasiosphaeria ovina]|uniref:RNA-dependent RNA polymerase n=1 Tax=Lasiosphaeria ovina TaxID=92902 RepID=A0AAE0N0Z4_9PEZI|nr:hypothetical protein B0T24DRAFT_596583 [Lasiosphaeria ovina]
MLPRVLEVSFLYPASARSGAHQVPVLRANCRKFLPGSSSVLQNSIEAPDGETADVEFPPYACLDAGTGKFQPAMNTYLDACQSIAEQNIDALTDDEIIKLTYLEARRFARSRTVGSRPQTIVSAALRIQFCDESGSDLSCGPNVSLDATYAHFKDVLSNGVGVAGRRYPFPGFSHSALRSRSVWRSAPFIYESNPGVRAQGRECFPWIHDSGGRVMHVRDSMLKFKSSNNRALEICDLASRPIKMFLNRSMVKILEGLGAPENWASEMLSSWGGLLRNLWRFGFDYREDHFLRSAFKAAVLRELRSLKRIL